MQLRDIQYVVTIADMQSFSKAAEALYISQPALSQCIKRLEADLGVAGGIGEGLIIKHGEVFKKVPESELLGALKYELDHWGE